MLTTRFIWKTALMPSRVSPAPTVLNGVFEAGPVGARRSYKYLFQNNIRP